MEIANDKSLVLYDNQCGFCSSIVRFLRRRDRKRQFVFVPLEAAELKEEVPGILALRKEPDTIVLVCHPGSMNQTLDVRSEAVLKIFSLLGGPWRAFVLLRIVPRRYRDVVYDWVDRKSTRLNSSHRL